MDEPEQILDKILHFEKQYTPQFTDLIKQSLTLDIEDIEDIDLSPSPGYAKVNQNDEYLYESKEQHTKTTENRKTPTPSPEPPPFSMNINNNNNNTNTNTNGFDNKPVQTTNNSNPQKQFSLEQVNLNYNSDDSDSKSHTPSKSSDEGDDEFQDPLIDEYETCSHDIHISKLKLRKIDRQITMAQRTASSASGLVIQHSSLKMKIAQLLSKRKELEKYEVVKKFIREELDDDEPMEQSPGPAVDNGQLELQAMSPMMPGISEDAEDHEDDISKEIKNKSISNDTDNNDANITKFPEDNYIPYLNNHSNHSSVEAGVSIDENIDNDNNDNIHNEVPFTPKDYPDDEDYPSDGSVKYIENEDDDDDGGGSVVMNDSEDSGETDDSSSNDNDGSDGAGSMVINDVDNAEEWNDATKEVKEVTAISISNDGDGFYNDNSNAEEAPLSPIARHDRTKGKEHHFDTIEFEMNDDSDDDEEDDAIYQANLAAMRKNRIAHMQEARSYKKSNDSDRNKDQLKEKYLSKKQDRNKKENNQWGIDHLEFDINDTQSDETDEDHKENEEMNSNNTNLENDKQLINEIMFDGYPTMDNGEERRKSVLLDINDFSLMAVIEEEDSDGDDSEEKYFRTVQYETDSDCDSNGSVVVKKEIFKDVSSNDIDLKQFASV